MWSKEIDKRIGKANAVLREIYRSVVTKRELSNIVKLSVIKSVCVPILTCIHESWLMTGRILSQVQAARLDFCKECEVTQGRTGVRWRPGQKRSLASPCSQQRFFESKCSVLRKKRGTLLGLFGTRSIVPSCPHR